MGRPQTAARPAGFVVRDGIRLAYDDVGRGEPALLLLHGMASDRRDMRPLLRRFARQRRVVNLELRGHGDSDVPEGPYSIEALVTDVLAAIAQLELDQPVLVGHSWGGAVSIAVADNHPELVSGIVLLDPSLRPPAVRRAELEPYYSTLGGPDHAQRVWAFVSRRLVDEADPLAVRRAVATMAATAPIAYLSTAREALKYDTLEAISRCSVPGLLVLAGKPSLIDSAGYQALPDQFWVARVAGGGHFVQLAVPEQVAAMIRRFLAVAVGPKAGQGVD